MALSDINPFGQQRLPGFEPAEGGEEQTIYAKLHAQGLTDKCFDQIIKHVDEDENGCWITNYKADKKNYKQVRFQGTKYYTHVIGAMKRSNRAPKKGEESISSLPQPTLL